jgi:hypothetical protein
LKRRNAASKYSFSRILTLGIEIDLWLLIAAITAARIGRGGDSKEAGGKRQNPRSGGPGRRAPRAAKGPAPASEKSC